MDETWGRDTTASLARQFYKKDVAPKVSVKGGVQLVKGERLIVTPIYLDRQGIAQIGRCRCKRTVHLKPLPLNRLSTHVGSSFCALLFKAW